MKTKLSPARRNRPVKAARRKPAKTARRRSLETQPFIAPILTVHE